MQYRHLHSWNITPEQARHLQSNLRTQVIQTNRFSTIATVAGVDIGFRNVGDKGIDSSDTKAFRVKEIALASVVVLSFPELREVERVVAESRVCFLYIPGLLSFREIPPLLKAFSQLKTAPDLVMVDGHGIAHPRRFGIASHLGLILDKPTMGCAKSRLWGKHEEPGKERGSYEYLYDTSREATEGEVIGAAVRTRTKVRAVYVSIGHRIALDSAITFCLACGGGYRLPEPTRQAHNAAAEEKKEQRALKILQKK